MAIQRRITVEETAKATERPHRLQVLLRTAQVWADLATCPRLHAACVIAKPTGRLLATGYNGAPSNLPHCTEVGCLLEHGHCVRTTHDVINAIIQAAQHGVSIDGAIIVQTHQPCRNICVPAIINAGISAVYYGLPYNNQHSRDEVAEMFRRGGVVFVGPISGLPVEEGVVDQLPEAVS